MLLCAALMLGGSTAVLLNNVMVQHVMEAFTVLWKLPVVSWRSCQSQFQRVWQTR
jgi:hypothetical protein